MLSSGSAAVKAEQFIANSITLVATPCATGLLRIPLADHLNCPSKDLLMARVATL
jgi:hypothetical protein